MAASLNCPEHLTPTGLEPTVALMGNASPDVTVELSRFNSDPHRYMSQATNERRVVVRHDGSQRISAVFGGSLDTPPGLDADPE